MFDERSPLVPHLPAGKVLDYLGNVVKACQVTARKFNWAESEQEVLAQFNSMFHVRLLDLVKGGWSEYRKLHRYKDAQRFPGPEDVPLTEHRIESTHHPRLEIRINGVPSHTVEFDLVFSLTLHSVVLGVSAGYIKTVKTGTIDGEVELGLSSKSGVLSNLVPKLKAPLGSFDLPGKLDIEGGIPVP